MSNTAIEKMLLARSACGSRRNWQSRPRCVVTPNLYWPRKRKRDGCSPAVDSRCAGWLRMAFCIP